MKLIKTMLIAAGTASVALAPIAATAAAPVAPVTAAVRAAPDAGTEADLRGRSGVGVVVAILALALIITGIVIAVDNNDNNPVSP